MRRISSSRVCGACGGWCSSSSSSSSSAERMNELNALFFRLNSCFTLVRCVRESFGSLWWERYSSTRKEALVKAFPFWTPRKRKIKTPPLRTQKNRSTRPEREREDLFHPRQSREREVVIYFLLIMKTHNDLGDRVRGQNAPFFECLGFMVEKFFCFETRWRIFSLGKKKSQNRRKKEE